MILQKEPFVDPGRISVIIPYSDLEKMAVMAAKMEVMEAQYKRLQEQYSAIQGMFSECLQVVREIREWVKDT